MDLGKLGYETNQLINSPLPSEGECVDAAGELAHIIQKLSAFKKALLSEVGVAQGEKYRTVKSRAAKRSYNTAGILSAFDKAGMDLRALIQADVARLTWRWSELKQEAYKAGVTLSIAPREIEDDGDIEAPLVGEVWDDQYRLEGK